MVIMPRHACIAKAAMFAACGLQEVTSAAAMPWVKENSVVRVASHLFIVILLCDEGLGYHAFVQ